MSAGWIEGLWPDGLESEGSHHGVEEDLQEDHVVSVGWLHDLDPLDGHLVLGSVVLCLVDREVSALAETVDAGAPVYEELQLLLDGISDRLENVLSELLGVVRDLRLKLDGVLVDALDLLLVEVDLEVVGVELQYSARSLWISRWLPWEQGECGGSFHLLRVNSDV